MNEPIIPKTTNIFPVEAMARYYEWCGATRFEALAFASGRDMGNFDSEQERPHWMPMNEAIGQRYTPTEFHNAMAAFADRLPGGFAVWGWAGKDPYVIHGDEGDFSVATETETVAAGSFVLGLTGGRGAGKTFLCEELAKEGFTRVHPFGPGKALLRGFYVFNGATEEEALAMTDGALKDQPAPPGVLPIDPETGSPYTSRFVMERLGNFLAKTIGLDSTIGRELAHWASVGADRILVDSVVYEEPIIRRMDNAVILSLQKADGLAASGIRAEITDQHVADVRPDAVLVNNMDGAERLMADFYGIMDRLGTGIAPLLSQEPSTQPAF